ncbi:MAG: ABC transporter ATP-binding protein [Candidatus Odinarchaeia archaeon]
MQPIVKIVNVTKLFNDKHALKNVSLEVYDGETLCLIGPSGAGKTTLLRLINMLDRPTSGKIFFKDTDLTTLTGKMEVEFRRKMSLVFQKPVLFNTTVFNNVAYGLILRKVKWETVKEKVRDVLKLVGLSGFEKKNALTLSGGEAQRVALARSIVLDPELLLLDEPTANLDPPNVAMIEKIIMEIQKTKKTTVIMATHNMYQAKRMGTRTAFLLNGELVEIGPTEEIFRNPQRKETESFINGEMIY